MSTLLTNFTPQIFFYLTIICNLANCSYNVTTQDENLHPTSGCKYPYPQTQSISFKIEVIFCRNMMINELPLFENVTKMELMNIPLTILNQTEIPKSIQSEKVNVRQLSWLKSNIKVVQNIPIPNLTELDLSSNLIQEIYSEAFEPLSLLHKLNLSHNSIEKLPENLFTKSSIRILSLSKNNLQTLPSDLFKNLPELEILDMSYNVLNYLHEDTFTTNKKLLHVDLSHNKLNSLPEIIFQQLTSLQFLSLEDNILIHLDPKTFSTLSSLMVLNIGKNPLWTLPNSLLPFNNTLFILTITHTKLWTISSSVFQNLHGLRNLYLSDNRNLQNLHNDTFLQSENLKILDLRNNNFTQLPYSVIHLVPDELLLDGNPWPCDCTVQWIVNWIKSRTEFKNTVQMATYCNTTNKDLIETVFRMQCKPTIVQISPISYQLLDVKVQLVCRAFSNPRPLMSWITPGGLAYIKSESALDLLKYHPTFESYPHLENSEDKVYLHENGDFIIKKMTRDDAGEYVCIATNKVGESFAHTRLYVDPSIMQRIKTGSIICGLLWVNAFLLFSIVYLLIRRCTQRANEEKRKQRMHENMDIYKSQQISRLRERCKNQMNRIKNNCSIQVEWMKENYIEFMKNTQDHRSSYLTTQYNQQMTEIREHYLTQMHKVREHYEQQRDLIMEFNVNQGVEDVKAKTAENAGNNVDLLVKVENGNISDTNTLIAEEDIYKYNDSMKSEIQKLTSLRNLHEVLLDPEKTRSEFSTQRIDPPHFDFIPKLLKPEEIEMLNGKLRTPTIEVEEDEDENTNMLNKNKGMR